jgi:NAD(P)-dependent dehydrogenase (short-subunit alcohol dehydrogenase family)
LSGICSDRVVLVTGAGRGIGRGEAIEFARQGAKVVVNDLGSGPDGSGSSEGPAHDVVREIRDMGGEAVANTDDVSDLDGAKRMIDTAERAFGHLDVVVNNAGILRDRMLVNMTPEDWDSVIKVHLRGTYAIGHSAAAYWRAKTKAGESVNARLITTSSASGIFGNVGQTNYGAAKAGIAGFTVNAAKELARYGVTVNSIAPGALTRLTENMPTPRGVTADGFDPSHPDNIAPLVVWLGSEESAGVTGKVFTVTGGHIGVAEGWAVGQAVDKGARWDPAELGAVVTDLVARARPDAGLDGRVVPATAN